LIKNAVQHNNRGGYITLSLNKEKFQIENSGQVLNVEPSQLFRRFQKNQSKTENLGLGLSINQRICELYDYQLDYKHKEGVHLFTLTF
ncbi:MAG: ATP-binding protein, partial [Bacteroidota bacterium]